MRILGPVRILTSALELARVRVSRPLAAKALPLGICNQFEITMFVKQTSENGFEAIDTVSVGVPIITFH